MANYIQRDNNYMPILIEMVIDKLNIVSSKNIIINEALSIMESNRCLFKGVKYSQVELLRYVILCFPYNIFARIIYTDMNVDAGIVKEDLVKSLNNAGNMICLTLEFPAIDDIELA